MSSDCIKCCCPCLEKSNSRPKYAYVRYSESKSSNDDNMKEKVTTPTEKIFVFPQDPSESSTYPQMFVEKSDTITKQPSFSAEHRFSTQISTSSVGHQYSQYVATGKVGSGSESPSKSLKHFAMGISGSLPDLVVGEDEMTPRKSLLLRRRMTAPEIDIDKKKSWVPGLPILEEAVLNDETSLPLLQFSLYYDVQRCALTVHLHHASNVPAKDRRGTSDPFVVLYIMPNKEEIFESKIVYQSLNPVFDQSFEFKRLLPDDIRNQTLILRVYDHDRFTKNDTIGGVILPLENADLFGVVMRMQIEERPDLFSENSNGDILLALTYDPTLSTIKGILLKATNLKKQDVVGLADPYVKLRLYDDNKVICKWKSSIKRNTLVPIYNETFQFDIHGRDIEILSMEVLVMDYDRFSRDDIMGVLMLGSNVKRHSEARHWKEMILHPNQSISQWHSLRNDNN